MSENIRVTVLEMTRAELYRRAGLEPSREDLVEEEFEQLFRRPPELFDRRLGLERLIEIQRALHAFHAAKNADATIDPIPL